MASLEAAWGRSSWASAHCSQASRYCSTCSRNLCPCSICCRASWACSGLRYREWVLPAIGCPKKEDPNGGLGKTAIHKRLIALQTKFGTITRVVVVVDSDDDPAQAFTDAAGQFNKANTANPAKPYPVPVAANTVATLVGSPDTAIVLVPGVGIQGCLDSLLLPSFEQRFPDRINCVNDFCTCMNDPDRGVTKDATLRLRALIASAYPKKPGISLANLLEEGHCPVDLAHPSFNTIRANLVALFP